MRRRMARGKKKTVIDTAHPHTIKKFELIEEYIKSWSQKLVLYIYAVMTRPSWR